MRVLLRVYVVVPPGKRESSQMLPSEATKTNKIAKTWILVEQVIGRLKVFRFVANEVPINMLSYIDEILQIYAAISNMQNLDWNKTKMLMVNLTIPVIITIKNLNVVINKVFKN